jgi:thiamine pyrophosphate-dependent acetolactate synthase large subunit-like protein
MLKANRVGKYDQKIVIVKDKKYSWEDAKFIYDYFDKAEADLLISMGASMDTIRRIVENRKGSVVDMDIDSYNIKDNDFI